ncbi:MAG: hypothetical protein AAFY88_25155, partial [Acidobacteriota bacterium]
MSLPFLLLNVGHFAAHFFLLIYPTVVLELESDLERPYDVLLMPVTAGFVALGLATPLAGWAGDRWPRGWLLVGMFAGLALGAFVTARESPGVARRRGHESAQR